MVPEIHPEDVSILIVEDSPTQALKLQIVLEENGFTAAVAANGREALDSIHQRMPDVVISDIVMPEMNGHELCRALRTTPETTDLPVILLTNLTDPEDVIDGLTCGANSYVTKPFDTHFLLSRIHYILANRELRQGEDKNQGMDILFKGRLHRINLDQVHAIDLLLSTFESAVLKNKELEEANTDLLEKKKELTAINTALQTEIEEREQAQRALLESEERYRAIVEDQTEFVCRFLPDGMLTFLNKACSRAFHTNGDTTSLLDFYALVADEQLASVRKAVTSICPAKRSIMVESKTRTDSESEHRWYQWTIRGFFEDERPVEFQAVGRDVTDQREAEKRIHHMALHDTLTGLPNRLLLMDRLAQALNEAKRYGSILAVLFVDLDEFKPVNDTLGHKVGDEVLREVAQRLRRELRTMDTVARFGGDEFVVVLQNLDQPEAAEAVARKCIEALSRPIEVQGHACTIGASIGISVFPTHGGDEDELLKAADQAMYVAKHGGKGRYELPPGAGAPAQQ